MFLMNDTLLQTEPEYGCFEISIDPALISVSYEKIVYDLGYGEKEIPEPFLDIIKDVVARLRDYCKVRAGYTVIDISPSEKSPDGIFLGNRFLNLQKIITVQLKNAEKAALFTCTIGAEMETRAAELFREGDPVKGHFTDTVASVAIEGVADILHDHIGREMAKRGLNITNRFSPGYCGWPLTEQHTLFSFLPENFCGIVITDSALMIPKKSVSGIIGIGTGVKKTSYFCEQCNRKECTYRAYLRARAQKRR
jgi:hypothetical protein